MALADQVCDQSLDVAKNDPQDARVLKRTPPTEIAQLRGRLGATPFTAESYPMLRLVHPAPKGQEKRARNLRRLPSRSPTAEEQQRIHAAIKNVSRAYGGRDVLAEVMGVSVLTLHHRRTRSYGFAFLLARAAGIPVEQVLTGKPHEAGSCALCGRKGAR